MQDSENEGPGRQPAGASGFLELSDCPGAGVIGDPDITPELPSVPFTQFGFQLQGQISRGNQLLLLGDTSSDLEGLANVTPLAPEFVGERIYGRSGSAVRIR